MSESASTNSSPTPPASKSNRTLLIAGVAALLVVCVCVVVVAVLGGALYVSGRLAFPGKSSPTPVALVASTSTPEASPTNPATLIPPSATAAPTSPAVPNLAAASNSPTVPSTPTSSAAGVPPTPGATAAPWANWPVLFSEAFLSNDNGWNISSTQPYTADFGTVSESIGAGKLHLEPNLTKGRNLEYWPKNLPQVSDLTVAVDGLRSSGVNTDYGLFFRKDNNGNFYVFLIRDDKQQFAVYVYSAQWTTLIDWTTSVAIQAGQTNHLNVAAIGSHFTFAINGQQVATLDNNLLASGEAGVTLDMAPNTQAVFDFGNFQVLAPAGSAQATATGQSALATPTSSSQWPVVLSEGFVSNASGWNISATQPGSDDFGTYSESISGGKLTIDAKIVKGTNQKRWPQVGALSDMSVTTTAELASGPTSASYGLMFRRSDAGFYIFEVNDTKQFSAWIYKGQWTALINWTSTSAIHPGQPNQLNVTAVGGHFTFSVNGQQVGATDNTDLTSGVAGIVFDMAANTEAVFEFTNFVILAPTVASQATPTSPGQWPDLISDKFASNVNGWNIAATQPNTDDFGTYNETIGDGKLTIDAKVTKGTNQKRWPNVPAVSDFSASVDARLVSGPSTSVYGLMFRRDLNGNTYVFEVRDDKQFSVWVFQGQWTNLIALTKSDAIQPAQVNHLNVTAVGSHFTFSINNQQVGAVDDTRLTSGLTGIDFEVNPGEAVFEFSNFVIRAPSAGAQTSPTPAGPGGIVFSEAFTSNANGWNIGTTQPSTTDYGTFNEQIGNGTLRIDAQVTKGVNQKYWPKSLQPIADASISVDARRVSGPTDVAYGLMFRNDGNGNCYLLEINDTEQYSVWLYKGQWTSLVKWTASNSIQPGQVNHLNVTAVGSHFTFSINDQQVGAIDDNQLASGVAGLVFDTNPGQASFEFSNFVVKTP